MSRIPIGGKDVTEKHFTNYYTTYVKYDKNTDEYYIEMAGEALFHLGWQAGDDVVFEREQDTKKLIIKKKSREV